MGGCVGNPKDLASKALDKAKPNPSQLMDTALKVGAAAQLIQSSDPIIESKPQPNLSQLKDPPKIGGAHVQTLQNPAPIIDKLNESKPQWNEQMAQVRNDAGISISKVESLIKLSEKKAQGQLDQELPISSARKEPQSKIKSLISQQNEVIPDESNLGFHHAHVPPTFVISV